MNQVPPPFPQKPIALYSITAIGVAAFVGSPLAAGVLAAINFRRLVRVRASYLALLAGVVATTIVFGAVFLLPEEIVSHIPNTLIPAIYVPLAVLWARRAQGTELEHLYASGVARKASGWSTAGISIASLVILAVVIVPVAVLTPPLGFRGERVKFGPNKAHTLYVQGDMERPLVDQLCEALVNSGLAPNEGETAFQVRKIDARYELSIPISRDYWSNLEFLSQLREIRHHLRDSVLRAPVAIVLVDEDLQRTYHREL